MLYWLQGVCALFGAIQNELDGITAEALQECLSPQQSMPQRRDKPSTSPDPPEAAEHTEVSCGHDTMLSVYHLCCRVMSDWQAELNFV